jgi:hypothetical protein
MKNHFCVLFEFPRKIYPRAIEICVQTIWPHKVEDDLNFFKNGRRPQNFEKWKTTSKNLKWKTTSKMEDNLNVRQMEVGIIFF